jgi:RNA polymerase sigma factor (sigma-70 family)
VLFPDTQWTLIAEATLAGSEAGKEALAELYRRYEQPVLAHIRRYVGNRESAEDLAQAFWVHLIERRTWRRAEIDRGRFRTFLLKVLTDFLRGDFRKKMTDKRGGEIAHTELDREFIVGGDDAHQSAAFDRDWAAAVLERSLAELQAAFTAAHKEQLFVVLTKFLPSAEATPTYEDAARMAGVSVEQMRMEIHRLREKLRDLLRRQISEIVSAPDQIEEEFAYLRTVLASGR